MKKNLKLLTNASVKNWCKSPHGNKCHLARPPTIPNFVALGQTMYDKSVKMFTASSILAPQGDLLSQSSPILAMVCSKTPSIKLLNFVPIWKPTCEISAAKIRRFRRRRDRHKKQTLYDIVCALLCGDNKTLTRMWADAQRDGRPAEYIGTLCESSVIPFLVQRHKVWLTPTAGVHAVQ